MLDNTYPQKDPKKGARLSGGGPPKTANGNNKRPADSTPDPNLKKRRKDADLMPAPSVPVNTPAVAKTDRTGMTDLSSLPTSSLISYLVKHDVLPPVLPSPYTPQPALAPGSLLDPANTETPILTDLDAVHMTHSLASCGPPNAHANEISSLHPHPDTSIQTLNRSLAAYLISSSARLISSSPVR
ncbi:hypothetical protein OPQ81_010859 [Rhizoctonia solani]|nr:hypothetical protein OPQ81_010859 [Rhizoctonia solani]